MYGRRRGRHGVVGPFSGALFLLCALHVRAGLPGLGLAGVAGLPAFVASQAFAAGLAVLALLARSYIRQLNLGFRLAGMALLVGGVVFSALLLPMAHWAARTTGDTADVLFADEGATPLRRLKSSFLNAVDASLAIDGALAAVVLVLLLRDLRNVLGGRFFLENHNSPRFLGLRTPHLIALSLLGLLLGARWPAPDPKLQSPLLLVFKGAAGQSSEDVVSSFATSIADADGPVDFFSLRHGAVPLPQEMLDSLARTRKRWLSLGRTRPHVVLVLVESVGALNLLPGGRWDRELTPNMFAFAAEGALFPAVYSPFPATIRSHVSIMTGGYVLTWGSVYKDLGREFLGPTIPSTFRGKGYRTAFFSSGYMDSENSDGYYRGLGFEELFFPEELPPDDKKRLEISSWGIEEGHVADRALEWLLADSGSPALLVWNLNTPHHPYLIPGTAEPYEKGADDRSKHRSAMHHVDAVLGDFARRLKDAGLDNTVVALVGDHGEAFGIEHAGNFLHRSSLYEENVRSFAVLTHLGGALAGSPAVGDFPVGNGALLPTLAEMADGRPRAGSLFAPRARILYFFKNAGTQQVGLRDGGWKFVADQMKGGAVRLYKLDADPEFVPAYPSLPPEEDKVARADACETEDVSARYPELAAEYLDLCRRWLAAAQNAWASRLRGNTAEDVVRAEDLLEPGPKRIAVGHMEGGAGSDEEDEDEEDEDEDDEDDDGETFVPSLDATISVSAKPAIWTKNVAWIEDTNVVYAFRGPEGEERNVSFVHSSEWMDTYLYPAASLDGMREGRWEVVLWQGERRLLGMNFTVVA